MTVLPGSNSLFYGGGQVPNPANVLSGTTTPNSADIHHNIGTLYVNTSNGNVYSLTSKYGGIANWQILGGDSQYSITPYVVGPSGKAGYQTIQEAITAAEADGGGTIWIQNGTYTENLTITKNKINLIGYAGEVGSVGLTANPQMTPSVRINGRITINTEDLEESSYNTFSNLFISPPTGKAITFLSNGNTASVISFDGCTIMINEASAACFETNGFPSVILQRCTITENAVQANLLSIPGPQGFCLMYAINSVFETNSITPCSLTGTFDAQIYLYGCQYNSMIDISGTTSGHFILSAYETGFEWGDTPGTPLINFGDQPGSVYVDNSIYINGTGGFSTSTNTNPDSFSIIKNTYFQNEISLTGNCIDQYINCYFNTDSNPAITMNSTGDIQVNNCVITSSNNPAIDGTGVGVVNLTGTEFTDNSNINSSLTLNLGSTVTGNVKASNLIASSAGNGLQVKSGSNARIGTATLTAGTTGAIANTSVTSNTHIFVTVTTLGTVTAPQAMLITKNAGVGFTITSADATDTSTVDWFMVESI